MPPSSAAKRSLCLTVVIVISDCVLISLSLSTCICCSGKDGNGAISCLANHAEQQHASLLLNVIWMLSSWFFPFFFLSFISTVSVRFSCSLCPTLCDPMDCSTPGFPVHYQLPEFTQTHVHWVGDAIQPSHPLSAPSLPAFNVFQNRGLFKCVSAWHQVAKELEFQLQHQSFQWIFRTDFL